MTLATEPTPHPQQIKTPTLARAADFYVRWGLSVMAWRYTDGAKKPAHAWKGLQANPQTREQVWDWWRSHPADNVGVITGAVSGVVVVDCDDADAIAWADAHLPVTPWRVQTGRGEQRGFAHPGGPVTNRARVGGMALDVRGDGGYVAMPPSVHKNGQVYRWLGRPWEHAALPVYDPKWLPDAAPYIPTLPVGGTGAAGQYSDASRLRGALAWAAKREPAVAGQGGHLRTCKTAMRVATLGLCYADAMSVLEAWNATCAPPWNDRDLHRFLRTAWDKTGV